MYTKLHSLVTHCVKFKIEQKYVLPNIILAFHGHWERVNMDNCYLLRVPGPAEAEIPFMWYLSFISLRCTSWNLR